ncbi:YwmB family TATA-box binding protein [Paenibacillus allorhizosphaerae]|uniref:TATA-box binding protein n=1 Tax=Paenibacillus allorhizosphaerae TaxID=2849866 RepID=A0ABN7TS64_9BACL|nr:YwmB family TATA-box binding protein [Paenibacillus allorhizosphaerae]CAG7649010.1 hypothetical protein PAECIP111802_04377 [Paenibacillus allorhizosphaerae]
MRTKTAKTASFLVMLGILGLWLLQAEPGMARPESGAASDTVKMLQTAEQGMSEQTPVKLVLKKTGPYRPYANDDELLRLGQEWSRALQMPVLDALLEQQGEPVYRQERQTAEGCVQTLLLTALGAGQSYAIVKTECSEVPAAELSAKAVAMQDAMERQMEKLHFEGVWNVIAQGMLKTQSSEGAQEAFRNIQGQLEAKAVERYEDAGTVSISYTSDVLQQSVDSGEHRIHLQAAIHRDSLTKAWRLTIGTPVITTEY